MLRGRTETCNKVNDIRQKAPILFVGQPVAGELLVNVSDERVHSESSMPSMGPICSQVWEPELLVESPLTSRKCVTQQTRFYRHVCLRSLSSLKDASCNKRMCLSCNKISGSTMTKAVWQNMVAKFGKKVHFFLLFAERV